MKKTIKILLLALVILVSSKSLLAQNGVFAVLDDQAQDNFLIPQASIVGHMYFMPWSCIETSPGVYNWNNNTGGCTGVETAIGAPLCNGSNATTCFGAGNTTNGGACPAANNGGNITWGCAGKQMGIIVWGNGDSSFNSTPAYVWTALGYNGCVYPGCGVNCTGGKNVPDFHNSAYYTPFNAFLAAFAAQYGNDPRIAFYRPGTGGGGETIARCYNAQKSAYYGGNDSLMRSEFQTYTLNELAVIYGLLGTVPAQIGLNCINNPCLDNVFPDAIGLYAGTHGIGIGHEALASCDPRIYNGIFTDACGYLNTANGDWQALYLQYPTAFHDQQFNASTCPDPLNQSGNAVNGNPCQGSPITLLPFAANISNCVTEMVSGTDLSVAYANCSTAPDGLTPAQCAVLQPKYQAAIANYYQVSLNCQKATIPSVNYLKH
jgi:hypothetical protein